MITDENISGASTAAGTPAVDDGSVAPLGTPTAAALEDTAFDLEAAAVLANLRLLIRASDVFSKKLHKMTGLTTAQALTLRAVDELGEVTSRALSTVVAVSPATMTNVLDRLEAKTLIERYRSTVDRRIVHVRLTDDGQAILGTMPNLMDETFMLRFADLPAARRTQISTALREVAQMMNADATDAAPADNGQSSTPA